MARKLPEQFVEHVGALRKLLTSGLQGGLGVIQELDLTLTQALAVYHLAEHGPVGISELQTAVARSQAATSHLVEQLEQRGIVRRQPGATDRRRRMVALTARGRTAVAKVEAVRRQALESVLDPVPAVLIERFDAVLAEILEVLRG